MHVPNSCQCNEGNGAVFRIDPDSLYSFTALEAELAELHLTARQFLDRVRPRKAFRSAWWGRDLIEALSAYTIEKASREAAATKAAGKPSGRQSAAPEQIPLPTK